MKIKHLLVSLTFLFFVSACTKITETDIGTGLIPSIDGVITKDTNIYIDAKNQGTDTLNLTLYDEHALGYINDRLFGTTLASINVQMQPTAFPVNFPVQDVNDSLMLDSVVMALSVQGVWGDTTQQLSLHVKEIDNNQSFISDSSLIIYNTASTFSATNDITYNGSAQINPRLLNDSVKVFDDTTANMLRIRLTDEFGNRLLHTYDTTNAYKSDSAFRQNFKGFQITSDQTGNSLVRIGLATNSTYTALPNTKVALYYSYKSPLKADSIVKTVKYFTINTSTSAHSNHIERDLNMGLAGNYFPPSNGSKNDDFIYLQTSPGTYANLTVDSAAVSHLPNLIVHRAEIIMEQAPDESFNIFDGLSSPFLFLLAKQNDTTRINIPGFDSSLLLRLMLLSARGSYPTMRSLAVCHLKRPIT